MRSSTYGYGRLELTNKTHLFWEQINDDDGSVVDSLWLIKNKKLSDRSTASNLELLDVDEKGLDGSIEEIKEFFSKIGMMHHLGVKLTAMEEESAELTFTPDERHMNYMGMLHGGAVAAVVDTAAFMPGCLLPSGRKLTTEGVEVHRTRRMLFSA